MAQVPLTALFVESLDSGGGNLISRHYYFLVGHSTYPGALSLKEKPLVVYKLAFRRSGTKSVQSIKQSRAAKLAQSGLLAATYLVVLHTTLFYLVGSLKALVISSLWGPSTHPNKTTQIHSEERALL